MKATTTMMMTDDDNDVAGALLQGRALPHPACQRPLLRRPRGGQPARPHHGGRCQVVGRPAMI